MKTSLWLFVGSLFVLAGLNATPARAGKEGGEGSGGGNAVVLPNDKVVLADPYYVKGSDPAQLHCKSEEQGTLHSDLWVELKRATTLMVRYGAVGSYPNDGWKKEGVSEFFQTSIEPAEFCFVEKLPKSVKDPKLDIPADSTSHEVGYTEGNVTWIRKDLFRKMSVREQAKLIIHERLHAFAGNMPHDPIVQLTTALDTALELFYASAIRNERPVVNDSQRADLETLMQRIHDLRLDKTFKYEWYRNDFVDRFVVANGGGLIHKTVNVPASAYVGAGSLVQAHSILGENVALLNTQLCPVITLDSTYISTTPWRDRDVYTVKEGSILKNTWIGFCRNNVSIGKNAKIENSVLSNNPSQSALDADLLVEDDVTILNSELELAETLKIEAGAGITNVDLHFSTANQYYVNVSFTVGKGAKLSNMTQSAIVGLHDGTSPLNRASFERRNVGFAAGVVMDFGNDQLCKGAPSRQDYFEGSNMVMNLFKDTTFSTREQLLQECTR